MSISFKSFLTEAGILDILAKKFGDRYVKKARDVAKTAKKKQSNIIKTKEKTSRKISLDVERKKKKDDKAALKQIKKHQDAVNKHHDSAYEYAYGAKKQADDHKFNENPDKYLGMSSKKLKGEFHTIRKPTWKGLRKKLDHTWQEPRKNSTKQNGYKSIL